GIPAAASALPPRYRSTGARLAAAETGLQFQHALVAATRRSSRRSARRRATPDREGLAAGRGGRTGAGPARRKDRRLPEQPQAARLADRRARVRAARDRGQDRA